MATILYAPILSNIDTVPRPGDPEAARRGLERWREAAQALDGEAADRALAVAEAPEGQAILSALFGNAPFLGACATAEPDFLSDLLANGVDTQFAALLTDLRPEPSADAADLSVTAVTVRRARRRAALLIALADITGIWPIERAAQALSQFADAAIGHVVDALLRQAGARGELEIADTAAPSRNSGLIILGMGKLGGEELNYSSDIDLIVLFEAETCPYAGRRDIQDFFVRLTRRLVTLLEERTPDGYVFRTDLRLRPDPGATPAAISTLAAESYYESLGQNWERAAMIKARPVAGDIAAGERFLQTIRPFVWRKHLDFAAIQDIHSIKRQIQSHRGGGEIAVAGHNIKLGRGGIREIEFFAQTQQLIWGGRYPELRTRRTVDALAALRGAGRITSETEQAMAGAYWHLRWVEHRLQMVDDRQNHALPADDDALDRFALFLGHDGRAPFVSEMRTTLQTVAGHYTNLFSDSPALVAPTDEGGSLVFTGADDDQETLDTLARMGFQRPETVIGIVKGWHHGRYRATRAARAREILTGLLPTLLGAIATTADPDEAFRRFDEFLSNLPAGVQLFATLQSNPAMLDVLAEIMGSAPRLSLYLSRQARLVDAILSEGFFDKPPDRAAMAESLGAEMGRATDLQEQLDAARRWAGDAKFQVSVQQLRGLIDADAAGLALTDIADLLIEAMLSAVSADFARRYGTIAGASVAIVGFGKLGSRSIVRGSDLDLVMVYDSPDPAAVSDGERELAAPTYFARLTQRLVTAIETQTGEGQLYQVDLRLRPMGSDGPIATAAEALTAYYAESAWTWELMALTRARVVTGPAPLARRLEDLFETTLARERDPASLARDIVDMRRRIASEHGTDAVWSIKHVRGGLIDVEFIAQYLQLCCSGGLDTNTARALEKLADAGQLDRAHAETLVRADRLYHAVQAILRLCLSGPLDEATAPEGLRRVLARAGGAVDFDDLKRKLLDAQASVRDCFAAVIEAAATGRGDEDQRGGP